VLYLDVTDTWLNWSGAPTGVHRTLIGLTASVVASGRGRICAWCRDTDTWHEVALDAFMEIFAVGASGRSEAGPDEGSAARPGPLRGLVEMWRGRVRYVLPYGLLVVRARLRQGVTSSPWLDGTPGKWAPVHEERQRQLAQLPLVPAWLPGDRLLLPDSTWNQPGFFAALQGHPDRPRVIGFIYDMIQLDRPDFVGEQIQEQFRVWASEVARNSAEIVCISKHAARGMQRFVDALALGENAPIVRPIKFGNKVDEDLGSPAPGCTTAELPASLHGESGWILWLGSVDRRKNLDVVLLALEGLYASGRLRRKFVVAGRRAGGSEELIHRLRYNPLLRERVVFLDAPSDRLVGQLLLGSDLMVFSSWSEGYGLPVAEALQHGVPVLASNATSIPEVAGDLVDYFEPWDSRTLADYLARFDADAAYRGELKARAARFVPTSWDDTLDDILHGAK
jgi:glycosyltransferase involved in cell wall biosynthesis